MNRNVMQMQIYRCDFDHEEFNKKISDFCSISRIDDATKRNIELAFEELVQNNIAVFIEHNDERGMPIDITLEHYGLYDGARMTVSYGGERYDPVYDGDELSSLMVKKLFKSIKHTYNDTNVIVIAF